MFIKPRVACTASVRSRVSVTRLAGYGKRAGLGPYPLQTYLNLGVRLGVVKVLFLWIGYGTDKMLWYGMDKTGVALELGKPSLTP